MPLAEFAKRLLLLAETVYQWLGSFSALEVDRREKVALYAEEIASTLARAAGALGQLESQPADKQRHLAAIRELGRISGYIETIVLALEHHLDGRKLAGVKRRLKYLTHFELTSAVSRDQAFAHAQRLTSAEGFFRALADALRVGAGPLR
jgi:hypothetical protein